MGNHLLLSAIWWQAVKGLQGGLNASIHVYVSVSWQYSDSHTNLNFTSLKYIFFFCTYISVKRNFTCVCLPSPPHPLLEEHWSWVEPVWSLCIVRKTRAKAQMVSNDLKKDRAQFVYQNNVATKKQKRWMESRTFGYVRAIRHLMPLKPWKPFSAPWQKQSEQKQSRTTEKLTCIQS